MDDKKVTLEAFLKKEKRTSDGKVEKTERFYREITLPGKLNVEKSKQYWHNGTLTLEIPKTGN